MTASRGLPCSSCGGSKLACHYVCGKCWKQLPASVQRALNVRDTETFHRLGSLRTQLRNGVPLSEIEITP